MSRKESSGGGNEGWSTTPHYSPSRLEDRGQSFLPLWYTTTTAVHMLKGQCHEIFYSGFFIKQLLLFPSDMPRKDFEFFRIFMKLFICVIDSPVMNTLGSRDSPVCSSLGIHFGHPILRTTQQSLKVLSFYK